MTSHGVLCRTGWLTIKNNQWDVTRFEALPAISMDWLCEQALTLGFSHLWVMGDTGVIPDAAFFNQALDEWDLLGTFKYPPSKRLPPGVLNPLVSAVGCRRPRGGQKQLIIIFPSYITKWHWLKSDITPSQLLMTVAYLEKALGVPIGSGPSTAGMKLLVKNMEERGHLDWIERPTVDLTSIPFDAAAGDLVWERPLTLDEAGTGYLHKFDKNSAYLRACVAEKFGVGDPQHVFHGQGVDEQRVGIWKCAVTKKDMGLLPPAWDGGEWIAGPIIKLLRKTGHEVEIHEGWVFLQQHEVLRAWAETIWEVRQAFKLGTYTWAKNVAVRSNAYTAVKDIAVATIGLTQSKKFEESSYKQRPDWHCQVVSSNRATVYYNLLKVQKDTGLVPLMINMDALYYVSSERDPRKAIPGFLDKESSLGGYKCEWSIPLNDEARSILAGDEYLTVKLERLNRLERV